MKEPLKFTATLTDADGVVKATYATENLDQASVVVIQKAVSDALNGLASDIAKAKRR